MVHLELICMLHLLEKIKKSKKIFFFFFLFTFFFFFYFNLFCFNFALLFISFSNRWMRCSDFTWQFKDRIRMVEIYTNKNIDQFLDQEKLKEKTDLTEKFEISKFSPSWWKNNPEIEVPKILLNVFYLLIFFFFNF